MTFNGMDDFLKICKEKLAKWYNESKHTDLIVGVILAISWGATCIVVKLLTLCFSLTFSLKVATGIWMVLLLIEPAIRAIFRIKK